jgi:hypothetical protein
VTVSAFDTATGERVSGRVRIDGQDAGATNVPFDYTFGAAPPVGVVTASFYADAGIAWPPLRRPVLEVGIAPSPIRASVLATYTVAAIDVDTCATVDGEVVVDGAAVARTNVPFPYRFVVRRVRERDPESGVFLLVLIPPVIAVVAQGYPEMPVEPGI